MKKEKNKNGGVTTALLLAAGTGSRLYPLTQTMPKCLTMVNGKSILERLVTCLKQRGFKRLVVVTGHLEGCIREYLGTQSGDMKIDYIFNPVYETTNNIYSLWLAREMIDEPVLLVESDLVFDPSLLDDMLYPDRIAVSRMRPWMNGSTVTANRFQQVTSFQNGAAGPSDETRYKTVNIYSLSLASWQGISKRLDDHVSLGRVNNYYETVFAEMIDDVSLSLRAVSFDSGPWYEIDTLADLAVTEKLFSADGYATAVPNPIASQPVKRAKQIFQQTKSGVAETVTRALPGLGVFPPAPSLAR